MTKMNAGGKRGYCQWQNTPVDKFPIFITFGIFGEHFGEFLCEYCLRKI